MSSWWIWLHFILQGSPNGDTFHWKIYFLYVPRLFDQMNDHLIILKFWTTCKGCVIFSKCCVKIPTLISCHHYLFACATNILDSPFHFSLSNVKALLISTLFTKLQNNWTGNYSMKITAENNSSNKEASHLHWSKAIAFSRKIIRQIKTSQLTNY